MLLAAFRLRPSARTEGSTSALEPVVQDDHAAAEMAATGGLAATTRCSGRSYTWRRTGGLIKGVFVLLGRLGLIGLIVYLLPRALLQGAYDEMCARRLLRATARPGPSSICYLRSLQHVDLRHLVPSAWPLPRRPGVCSEREEDQWITLTSTPLSGDEDILRAKMIGPVWALSLPGLSDVLSSGVFGLLVGVGPPPGLGRLA